MAKKLSEGRKPGSGRRPGPKTLTEAYGVYEAEWRKIQPQYRERLAGLHYNQRQFEAEIKAEPSVWGARGLKSTAVTKYARNLVKSGYTWTQNRARAVLTNVNEYITAAWLQSTGRKNVQGRIGTLNMQDIADTVLNNVLQVMKLHKQPNQILSTYKLTENDVLTETQYFDAIIDSLNSSGIGGDDVYGS